MYSPTEINFMYKLKKSMLIFFPALIFAAALVWSPPAYLVQAIGLGESLEVTQAADTIAAKTEIIQRKVEIIQNLQQQLDACNARTAPAIGEGKQLPPLKKFENWADYHKKNPTKTFSNFSAEKADFYEKQLTTIYKIAQ